MSYLKNYSFRFWPGFLFLLLILPYHRIEASGIYENGFIEIQEGHVIPARFGKVVFADRFDHKDIWSGKTVNYENRLKIDFAGKYRDVSCLTISMDAKSKKGDTAWRIESRKIDLTEKTSEFALSLTMASTANLSISKSYNLAWDNKIRWYDHQGKPCGEQGFKFFIAAGGFRDMISYGSVPKEAVSFSLQLGFDVPNIDPGNLIAFQSVELAMIDPACSRTKSGWFVSEILTGGPVSWEAETPQGTSVRFQVAAVDPEATKPIIAVPDFHGPDGTDQTYYEKPFKVDSPLFRYKVVLTPTNEKYPILKSVTSGRKVMDQWTFRCDTFPPRVKIVSQTPTRNPRAEIVLEITDDAIINWKKLAITVDGSDRTKQFTLENSRLRFQPDSDWKEGLHTVQVTVSDLLGYAIVAQKYFLIGDTPTTPKITLRDDGMTLIDGKPFFPIGIYGVMKREFNDFNIDKAFHDLREAGFNFAHSYSMPRTDEFLAAAQKYDFKLWCVARQPDERFLKIERNHPAIIAWYLGDDTSANTTPSELFDRHDAMKATDPTRITTQADPVDSLKEVSNYQDYVAGTDNFLPEIYPIMNDGPDSGDASVAQVVLDMKRCFKDIQLANDGAKSIWPIIQYFEGWGWKRFPTYQELRGMSFAAIIHGAHGITWYTYGGLVNPEKKMFNYGITTTPERWKNMSTVAKQIQQLSPVLLERTPKHQPTVKITDGPQTDYFGNPSVSCLLKEHEGNIYLLSVNASPKSVQTELSGVSATEATVMFENRTVKLSKDILTDHFEGYEVHIYKCSAKKTESSPK